MDRAPPPHARRPIAPLAVVSTVAASPAQRRVVHPAAVGIALLLSVVAVVVNSPLIDLLGFPDAGAWRFIGFWAEGGCIVALLGMLFRQPAMAWIGAGGYFGVSLAMAMLVWPAHLVSVVLLAAVAAWHVEFKASQPPSAPSMYPPCPPYPPYPPYGGGWAPA